MVFFPNASTADRTAVTPQSISADKLDARPVEFRDAIALCPCEVATTVDWGSFSRWCTPRHDHRRPPSRAVGIGPGGKGRVALHSARDGSGSSAVAWRRAQSDANPARLVCSPTQRERRRGRWRRQSAASRRTTPTKRWSTSTGTASLRSSGSSKTKCLTSGAIFFDAQIHSETGTLDHDASQRGRRPRGRRAPVPERIGHARVIRR